MTIDHFLRSDTVWLAVYADGTAARWDHEAGRARSAPLPLGSLLAHLHVAGEWERVEP